MYEINQRIREEMERQKLTMTDLANKSGLSRSTISRYVSDTIEPKQNAVGSIAKALGVDVSWLLFGVEGQACADIELHRLNPENRARLLDFYKVLISSQGGDHNGNG